MTIEVRVPQLPESVADATLVSWHKKPGDAVARDENLVDLETDKVVLEVPAPVGGVLKEIKLGDGTTVTQRSAFGGDRRGCDGAAGRERPGHHGRAKRCDDHRGPGDQVGRGSAEMGCPRRHRPANRIPRRARSGASGKLSPRRTGALPKKTA